jgi:hypothetical protein
LRRQHDIVKLGRAIEVRASGQSREQAGVRGERNAREALAAHRGAQSRMRLCIPVQREIAEDGAEDIRAGRAVHVAVGSEHDFEAAAERAEGVEGLGVEADRLLDLGRQAASLCRTQFATGLADVTQQGIDARQFKPHAPRARPFVEDLAQFHSRFAIAMLPVRQHQGETEARLAAQVDIGIGRKGAIGALRRGIIPPIARGIGKREKLSGRDAK